MRYSQMSVRYFLREVKAGNIDLGDFYGKLYTRLKGIQKNYNYFVNIDKSGFQHLTKKGKLSSLPISVKDNISTEGLETTAGSQILKGYKPPYDAFAIEKVKREGGIIIGKTQMDEFGFGTFSINSGYGIPRNPMDRERVCGGSSGGAAGLTRVLDYPHIAMAVSTGGSISCPASFCGVVGFTPTYGMVSRWGLIDYANSLDKIGVMGKQVDDAALMMDIIHGFDTRDFTSLNTVKRNFKKQQYSNIILGIPREYFKVDERIEERVWEAISFLETQGCSWKKVSLPSTRFALPAYYVIASAEASTNLARYCGMRYGPSPPIEDDYFANVRTQYLGEEAKRRIMLGTFARLAGYRKRMYEKAMQVRSLVVKDFEKVFKQVDVLVAPTMPILPPTRKEAENLSPIQSYQMDYLTVPANLAGIPHLNIPWTPVEGLPVGVHLIADHMQERKLLTVGRMLEKGQK